MYPPQRPVPPRPIPSRHGMPAGGVVGIAVACSVLFGMAGCAVGYAMGAPSDTAPAVGKATVPAAAETSPAAPPSRTAKPKPKVATIGDGTWRVPEDMKPGTYRTTTAESCYWTRLRGFSGKLSDIIASDLSDASTLVVTVKASDAGFSSKRCGTWTRIGK